MELPVKLCYKATITQSRPKQFRHKAATIRYPLVFLPPKLFISSSVEWKLLFVKGLNNNRFISDEPVSRVYQNCGSR